MDSTQTTQQPNSGFVESLTIDSRLSQLGLVAESSRAFFGRVLDEQTSNEIQLCVIEAVTNVIEHAYCYEEGKVIQVEFSIVDGQIVIEVMDWGTKMDPSVIEQDSDVFDFDPDDLDSLPEGGMGIEIMKRHMDHIECLSQKDKNILRLIRKINPSSTHS